MANKSKAVMWLEYIPAVFLMWLLRLLPYKAALRFGEWIGRSLYHVVGSTRRDTLQSLRTAFPEMEKREIERIAKASFGHMVMGFLELVLLPKLSNDRIMNDLVTVTGLEQIDRLLEQNKGIIVLAAHLGGWEFISAAGGIGGYNPHVLVRPLDNTLLDRDVERYREAKGASIIERNNFSLRKIFTALKANKPVAFLIDQNAARHGVFVPFFGKLASTARGPVQIALKTGAPIICSYDIRHSDLAHTVHFGPVIEIEHRENDDETIRATTAKFTKVYEDVIRAHPEQWLWAHPRWRTRPPGE